MISYSNPLCFDILELVIHSYIKNLDFLYSVPGLRPYGFDIFFVLVNSIMKFATFPFVLSLIY